jgi:general secretion pathway protein K
MIAERRHTMRRSGGFALIVVLWFLVLIAAISTYLMANARSETAIARNIRAAATAEALADAAVAETVFNQTAKAAADRWKLDGEPHLISLSDGEVTVRLYNENHKVNPNHASDALMAALFEAAGGERALAKRLGASIADWVDPETEPRRLGAEMKQYVDAGRSYGPPNAPIESIDDLQLVLGMTPEILALVGRYLTIHTESKQPDGNNALPIVKRALALASRAAAIDLGDDESPDDASIARTAPAANVTAHNEAIVRLVVIARASNGGIFVRDAVLKLDSKHPKSYIVLDWRRGNFIE